MDSSGDDEIVCIRASNKNRSFLKEEEMFLVKYFDSIPVYDGIDFKHWVRILPVFQRTYDRRLGSMTFVRWRNVIKVGTLSLVRIISALQVIAYIRSLDHMNALFDRSQSSARRIFLSVEVIYVFGDENSVHLEKMICKRQFISTLHVALSGV